MGNFLLGFGLLPYGVCPCACVWFLSSRPLSPPPSSLSGPMPVQPNFRGQGLSCICGIASSSDGQLPQFCASRNHLPSPDAPARLHGQGFTSERAHRADTSARLVNMSSVQHRVYGGFAWRQISASKGQFPWNNAHPGPLRRQIRGRSSNAIWQQQCQPPAEELPAQSGGVFSESRPPSPGWQPLLVSCQASLALAALRNRRIADNVCWAVWLSDHRALYLEFQLASGRLPSGPVLPNTGVFTQ